MILTIIIGFETRNKRALSFLDARTATLFKKSLLAQAFSCQFCEISKNTFFYRTPLVAAFVSIYSPMWYEFFVFKRTGKFSIRPQASTGGWNEANTALLQRRWYCSGVVMVLFQFLVLSGLTMFTSFEVIAVYITLTDLVSLSLVSFVSLRANAPFSAHFLFTASWIDNLTISFDINKYIVFTFTMVTTLLNKPAVWLCPPNLLLWSLKDTLMQIWKFCNTFVFI